MSDATAGTPGATGTPPTSTTPGDSAGQSGTGPAPDSSAVTPPAGAGSQDQTTTAGRGQEPKPADGLRTSGPPPQGADTDQKKTGPAPASKAVDDARDISALPEWVQKELKDARRGEAAKREAAKTAEAAKREIEDKHSELLNGIAKVLGLAPDEKPEEVDPAKLTADLEAATQRARETQIELAVYRAAGRHCGDPDALLDSRSFLTSVLKLDPAGESFGTDVEHAITAALGANPKLRAAAPTPPPAQVSGGSFSGGPQQPDSAESLSVDDFRARRRKASQPA